MNFSLFRRGKAVAAVAAGAGVIALAGMLPASAATSAQHARHAAADHRDHRAKHARHTSTARRARPAGTDWVHAVVLVNCQHHAVILPRTFILTCADANDFLTSLRWVSWRNVAYGSGIEKINSCVPDCAAGHFHSYRALITLWRARARGHGTGQLKFTRLTEIYPGARPARFNSRGKVYHPVTFTWHV